MIITIKNDDGEAVYDVSKIEDEQKRAGANVSISKIGTLNVLVEALNYASQGHQNNLEALTQSKGELAQMEAQLEMQRMEAEGELKKMLMEQEFQYNMQLRQVEIEGTKGKEKGS